MDNKKSQSIQLVKNSTSNIEHTDSWFIRVTAKYEELKIAYPAFKIFIKFLAIIIELFLIIFLVVSISFFLIDSSPGKPGISSSVKGPAAKAIEDKYHLNDPQVERWLLYLKNIFKGKFGISLSIFPGVEINSFVWERFASSSVVGVIGLVLTLILGVPLGVWSGKKITGFSVAVSSLFIAIMISIPSMVFGLLLLLLGRTIGIPYIYSSTNVLTWIIPSLALALPSTIAYIKYIRTTMNDEIVSQHAKFAKLKGVSSRKFIWKHALKPSLFPLATFFPASIMSVFIGGLFIEKMFSIPGSGFLFLNAAQTKDTYVLLLLTTIYTIMTIFSFRLRDWLYSVLDPRLRRRGE